MARVHKNKLECALEMLEKGASFREIARTCGLSFTQVSEIADAYGYYVDVREEIQSRVEKLVEREQVLRREIGELEKQKQKLQGELKELEEKRSALAREVERLEKTKKELEVVLSELSRRAKDLLAAVGSLCAKYRARGLDRYAGEIGRVAKDYVDELVKEVGILVSPELIVDLKEVKRVVAGLKMPDKLKEELESRLARIESSLLKLSMVMVTEELPVNTAIVLEALGNLCKSP